MFNFSRIQFEIEMLDDFAPYGFWGPRLRGYGNFLKNKFCQFPQLKTCESCDLFHDAGCEFPNLYKPDSRLFSVPPTGKPLGNLQNLPAPYVITAPFEVDEGIRRSSRITFDFTALGYAARKIGEIIESFGELGDAGLDTKNHQGKLLKARYQMVDVKDLLAGGRSLHVLGNIGNPVIRDASQFTGEMLPAAGPDEIIIEFVTITIIHRHSFLPLSKLEPKARGVRDFYEFVQILTERLGGLWQIYGSNWFGQANFYRWQNELLKKSKDISVKEIELNPKSYSRFDKDSQAKVEMNGFVGAMQLAGDFTPFMELLLLGEIFHIGESTAFGCGQYKLAF